MLPQKVAQCKIRWFCTIRFAALTGNRFQEASSCPRGNGIGLFGIKYYRVDAQRAVQCCFYVDVAMVKYNSFSGVIFSDSVLSQKTHIPKPRSRPRNNLDASVVMSQVRTYPPSLRFSVPFSEKGVASIDSALGLNSSRRSFWQATPTAPARKSSGPSGPQNESRDAEIILVLRGFQLTIGLLNLFHFPAVFLLILFTQSKIGLLRREILFS